MKRIIFLLIIALLFLPLAFAMEGKIPLLAVKQTNEGIEGSTAELFLEIKEGSGRVFVDTFPLSKIDTQISMRFAKEIACDFLEHDCDGYDFIYTIKANSPIIGGPSAGAAASVLTVSVLTGTPLKQNFAITGTINSGNLIGPVGGIKEKIEAGSDAGLSTILIPEGENVQINESDNQSLTVKEHGSKLGVDIIEVADMNSALEYFTGKQFMPHEQDITISASYIKTMELLANQLCQRNSELINTTVIEENCTVIQTLYDSAINLSKRGEEAFEKKAFYSAASYCYGSNVKLNQVFLENKNFSETRYKELFSELQEKIKEFDRSIDKREIQTITDLESYMVVKERLIEAMEFANFTKNDSSSYNYAYANERLLSAYSWSKFFNNQGKVLKMDKQSLEGSCSQRIAETEERLQYTSLYLPFRPTSPKEELDKAYRDFNNGNFALCLFKASKAKAETNIILNTLGVDSDYVSTLIKNKLSAAASVISRAEKENTFPVLGYSYYEYASSLKDTDAFSALLYAEYALELSNLDIYFREKEAFKLPRISQKQVATLIVGILIGMMIASFFRNRPKKHRKK